MLALFPYLIPIFSTIIVVQLKNNYGVLNILLYMQIKEKKLSNRTLYWWKSERLLSGSKRCKKFYKLLFSAIISFINLGKFNWVMCDQCSHRDNN